MGERPLRPYAVRRAVPADAAGIVALLDAVAAEGWLGVPGAPRTADQEQRALTLAPPEDFAVWVAETAGDGVVGHLLLARGPRPACAHVASVAVAVARTARGRGCGGALLEAAAGWAAAHGVGKLCAEVQAGNDAALRLFERHGFEREGLRRGHVRVQGVLRDEHLLARFVG